MFGDLVELVSSAAKDKVDWLKVATTAGTVMLCGAAAYHKICQAEKERAQAEEIRRKQRTA